MIFKQKRQVGSPIKISLSSIIRTTGLAPKVAADLGVRFEMGLVTMDQLLRDFKPIVDGISFPAVIQVPSERRVNEFQLLEDEGENLITINNDICVTYNDFCNRYNISKAKLIRLLNTDLPEDEWHLQLELCMWKKENNVNPSQRLTAMEVDDGSLCITTNRLVTCCTACSSSSATARIKRWLEGDLDHNGLTASSESIGRRPVGKPNWGNLSSKPRDNNLKKIK